MHFKLLPFLLVSAICLLVLPASLSVAASTPENWDGSVHQQAGLSCTSCHEASPSSETSHDPEICASCHETEFREWKLSPHNVSLPYTYEEIGDERIRECAKCHNATGFIEVLASGEAFSEAWASMPASNPAGVTCSACHDPHGSAYPNQLRMTKGQLCTSCHGSKWQTLMLTGESLDEYPQEDYSYVERTPHNTNNKCVRCHMAEGAVPNTGNHTLLMKNEAGAANTTACKSCHGPIENFNFKGRQQKVAEQLVQLREYLKSQNGGELPGFQPGNCNRCHRGGTLPFKNDPDGKLDKAYQVYLFVTNDASLGVHNPKYASKLLRDALQYSGGASVSIDSAQSGEDDVCLSCKW